MDFLNAWWMVGLALFVMLFVLSQSVFFLVKAVKRARYLEIDSKDIKRTITSTMVFSIAPSMAILIGLLALSKVLGVIVPWMRLSVLGAVTYELPATVNVVEGVFNASIGTRIADPQIFVTVLWVMTLGIIPPLIIIPLFLKRIQGRVQNVHQKDRRWGEIFMSAMFLGMISAFLGYVVAPREDAVTGEMYISFLAIFTLLSSAMLMVIFGIVIEKYKQAWLRNYALSFSMLISMGLAILYAFMGVR